jgi:YfiH family protein
MYINCPHLSQFPAIGHAFFEADPKPLPSRQDRVMKVMAGTPLPLVTLRQVHGNKVIIVKNPGEIQEADGLVTNTKGIALGILTADCSPVLLYDPIANVIGACHAGWRGARQGILQETLKAMEELGAKRSQIYATLGPTIQQANYEVGPEFPNLIGEPYETYFYPSEKNGFHYFNLPLYIKTQLLNGGLAHVYDLGHNTFTGNFSSRRRFLAEGIEEIEFCNLSAIAIL